MMSSRMLTTTTAGLAWVLSASLAIAAETIVIRGAHTNAPADVSGMTWTHFASCIEKSSNGRVSMKVYPSAMMGNDLELVDKVASGTLEIGHASTSNLAALIPDFAVFDLPLLLDQTDDNVKLFYRNHRLAGPIAEHLQAQFAKKNLRILWVDPLSVRVIHNRVRPVKVPDDMKGLKMRVTASKVERDDMAAFGANPITMGFGEVPTALTQGTIDGFGIPFSSVAAANGWDYLKYTVAVPFNGFFIPAFANKKFYDGLPADIRKNVDDCAYETVAEYDVDLWKKTDENGRKLMAEHGMQIYTPTASEFQLWKAALQTVYTKYAAQLDKTWLRLVEDSKHAK